jgi:F-type H+-transporting ATPase subunit a
MHDSWFSLLPGHERVAALARHYFGWPVNEEGRTWLFHGEPGVQHVYAALLVLALIVIVAVATDTSIRDAGKNLLPPDKLTLRNFVELLVGTAYRTMSDIMGPEPARYFLPLIGTCAFFILFSNALGLIPGFLPATDNFNTTLAMGVVIFVTTHVYGLKHNGWNHIKHFFGPIWWLAPLMLIIELISHIARPISLGIRLMANMMADHLVLGIFLTLLPIYLCFFTLPMYLLGTLVVVVQALVFCLLSTVYIAMAIEHAEEH